MVASKNLIVHDDKLNIDRQIIAGQEVPSDLLDAYQAATGENVDDAKAKVDADSVVEHVGRRGRGAKHSDDTE